MSNRLDSQQIFRWNLHQLNRVAIELELDPISIDRSAESTFVHFLPVFREKIKVQWLHLLQQLLGEHDIHQVQRPSDASFHRILQLAHAKRLSHLLVNACESFEMTYPHQPHSLQQIAASVGKMKDEINHQKDWWLQIFSLVKYLPHEQQQQYIPKVTWLSSQEKAEQLRALRKTVEERSWFSRLMNTTYSLHPDLIELNKKMNTLDIDSLEEQAANSILPFETRFRKLLTAENWKALPFPCPHFKLRAVEKLGIWLSTTPISAGLYQQILGKNLDPQQDMPIRYVSLFEAMRFCNALSVSEGLDEVYELSLKQRTEPFWGTVEDGTVKVLTNRNGYRLPTWEEWYWVATMGESLLPQLRKQVLLIKPLVGKGQSRGNQVVRRDFYNVGVDTTADVVTPIDISVTDTSFVPSLNVDADISHLDDAVHTNPLVALSTRECNAWGFAHMWGHGYEWCHSGLSESSPKADVIGDGLEPEQGDEQLHFPQDLEAVEGWVVHQNIGFRVVRRLADD